MGPFQSEVVMMVLDGASTVFSVVVLVFLAVAGRKDPQLRGGFYVIFMAATFVDCLRAITVCLAIKSMGLSRKWVTITGKGVSEKNCSALQGEGRAIENVT